MDEKEALSQCNCKDKAFHYLTRWHENDCAYKNWYDGIVAAQQSVQADGGASHKLLCAKNNGFSYCDCGVDETPRR